MSKSPNSDIIDKIYFRNIYSCQRKIYWYKVKVMETINAVWEHSYGEDCIPNFSANMEQPRHRWYEFKEGFSLTLVERAIRETKKDNKSTSSCAVLSQIWTDEAKREFVQKPEHFMRDSLWQCLQNILRNHTVKREQIVDATHPVDIKVTWPAINNVALIEVKWLGDSGQTQYRDARANEGAKQLIDYLASSVQEEPDKHFVGYLTVFDGRRGKTSNQYERQEINYRSEYSSHPSMNYRRFYMAECV